MPLESKFQSDLKKELKVLFPGCIVMKNDASYLTGIPDLVILYKHHWAVLECKRSYAEHLKCLRENKPANQAWYVETMNDMSFAAFIYPENREEILVLLQQAFGLRRPTRNSKRQ